eukprot:s9218_g1.t1
MGAVGPLADLRPWTSLPDRQYMALQCTPRIMAIIDCVTMQVLGGAEASQRILQREDRIEVVERVMADVLVDVSQNPIRRAYSKRAGLARCMHTASQLFSFRRGGLVLPVEKMFLLGRARDLRIPSSMTVRDLSNLAGMGICLPCLGLIVLSMATTCGL